MALTPADINETKEIVVALRQLAEALTGQSNPPAAAIPPGPGVTAFEPVLRGQYAQEITLLTQRADTLHDASTATATNVQDLTTALQAEVNERRQLDGRVGLVDRNATDAQTAAAAVQTSLTGHINAGLATRPWKVALISIVGGLLLIVAIAVAWVLINTGHDIDAANEAMNTSITAVNEAMNTSITAVNEIVEGLDDSIDDRLDGMDLANVHRDGDSAQQWAVHGGGHALEGANRQ
ncbi:MAG: hypothetical protein WC636_06665, partial [Candidatus Margulisiibacteriota bacterium]